MEIKYLKCDWGMEGYGTPKERLKKYKDALVMMVLNAPI